MMKDVLVAAVRAPRMKFLLHSGRQTLLEEVLTVMTKTATRGTPSLFDSINSRKNGVTTQTSSSSYSSRSKSMFHCQLSREVIDDTSITFWIVGPSLDAVTATVKMLNRYNN